MKRRNFAHRPGCAVEATLDLIDGKWKGVRHLAVRSCGGGCPGLLRTGAGFRETVRSRS
jgi:hypothetical protein